MQPEVHAEFLRRHVGSYGLPGAPIPTPPRDLDKAVADLIQAIKDNTVMKSLSDLMFKQVDKDPKWAPDNADYRVRDLDHLKWALTSAIQGPPEVYVVERDGKEFGEAIGIPIYLVLDLLINTQAAFDLFRMDEFNKPMKKLLDEWYDYLRDESPNAGSNSTLNESKTGWFGPYGLKALLQGIAPYDFHETYGVKPEEAKEKYPSWDKFFIRPFADNDKLRPVKPAKYVAIYNACESTTLRTAHNVKLDDTFWLKSQKYSLYDMLGGNTKDSFAPTYAERFIGGSVYQAFLAPQDYHHWHSPIAGKVLEAKALPGTYYSALPDDGVPEDDPYHHLTKDDPHGALMRSQPWLSLAAARGIVIIEPTEKSIDLVGVIAIGMVEVSTIDIKVRKDDRLTAGQELGMFHFGGSSHVVIVKPKDGYEVSFLDEENNPIEPNIHRWVRSIIGRVTQK
jgi:phosphatidylserine decarboxylase